MTPFELFEPSSLADAIGLLDPDDPTVRPISGGTALMLMMKAGVFQPTRLVSLRGIEKRYTNIAAGEDGALTIGAMTPLAVIERSEAVRQHAPVISRTMRTLSNIRVRNVATVGGHLAHADPHMDLPPVLIALGAHAVVTGPSGERTIPIEQLFSGYYETVLARNELISELVVPALAGRKSSYLKCTTRAVHDWPALGVAVSIEGDHDMIKNASVIISAATERPIRLAAAEMALRDGPADETRLHSAGEAAAEEAETIEDAQGSAAYKKQLVRVYVARAVREALGLTSGARH